MKKSLFFAGLAAATLALVGCNKEADVRGLDGVPVGIVLSNVDTRTVNDGMATKWEENDALNVFYAPAGTQTYSDNTKFVVDDADANHATGTADLTAEAYDWYLLYPYESHIKTPANTNAGYLTVGSASNKTQTQAGLNSTAHLAGKNLPVYGVAKNVAVDETPSVSMKHVSSVVAVNLTNATDQPLTVSSVSFTAPEDIVGTYYIDFSGDALGFTGSGTNYVSKTATLNVTGEEALAAGASAKFYIAVKPFAAKVGDKLAVKVVAGDVVFEKEITLPSAVEFKSGMIKQLNVSYDGGSEIKPSSLTEIAAMDKGANIQTNEVLVVAKYARGVMLAQDGFYLLAFNNNGVDAKIGDIVTVSGEVGEYAGLKQIANPVVEVISSDNEVVLPEPKVLEGLDDYASEKFELIQYSGTMAVSGNYFNVNVDGSTRQGSIQYPLDADAMKALDKKLITATGFFTGITGSGKYVNMMSTSVEEKAGNVFDATPTQINVAATATSAEINVTGNVDWTAEASTGATLDKTSGTGEAVITVSFPANEDQQNTKEYTVFVRTEATGVNDEIEINITQAKAVSSDEPMFVKVTASSDLVSGKYLIVSEEGGVAMKDAEDVGGGSNTISVTPADGMIAVTDALKAAQFTFDLTEGFIQGPNGKYIGQTSDANGMKVQDTGIANEISVSAGDADIISGGAHLRYNANAGESNLRFRYYKSASYTNQKAIQLYKLINDGGDTPPVVATLVSIAVSGQKTVFTVGDTFVFDGTVTASYSNGTSKKVTPTSVSEPDMTTAGTKEVTVSYTEGEVTKTAKYDITVNAAAAASTIAQVLAGGAGTYNVENVLVYSVKGANAIIGDSTGKMLLYKSGHGMAEGDIYDIAGATVTVYNGVLELTNGTFTKKSEGNPVNHGTAVSLDDAASAASVMTTFSAEGFHSATYVTITGKQSGRYIQNDNAKLYLNLANGETDGHKVVATGYIYSYSTQYSNYNFQLVTIETASDDLSIDVSASSLTWEAADTDAKTITVTTTNPATNGFTVAPASLEYFTYSVSGNVITVSLKGSVTANQTETLTLTHTGDASLTKTVTLTRKFAPAGFSVVYQLTPASGSNNGYANNCDIEINGITWNLTGNSTIQPWRIGGKSLDGVDRELYSKTAMPYNIERIDIEHGTASGITVNSFKVIVASDAEFNNVISTLTPTFAASSTITVEKPSGADWNNCYYKFVYNVTVEGNNNKFLQFVGADFIGK